MAMATTLAMSAVNGCGFFGPVCDDDWSDVAATVGL